MPSLSTLAVFIGAALVLLAIPGPSVLYIVTQSISHGRAAGLVSVLGVQVGATVHVAAATIGVSSILLSSARAFQVVKYAGAAYLIFLGLQRLLRRGEEADPGSLPRTPFRRLFARGVLVNVMNPKTALFFYAFLPQFVDPDRGVVALQMLLLGGIFVALAMASDGTYALLAGTIGRRLWRSVVYRRLERFAVGSIFIGLGVATAVSGPARK